MGSIFTRIIKREVPAEIVWENETLIVIMDVNPVSEGHLLVIPKEEEDSLFALSEAVYHDIWKGVRWLELPLKNAIGSPRIGIAVEGFGVPHVHIHMVPVYHPGDLDPHRAKKAAPDRLAEIAARIRGEIGKRPQGPY